MANITWEELDPDAGSARTSNFLLQYNKGIIPGALWLPISCSPKALILVGHGGSRHKRDNTALDFVSKIVEQAGSLFELLLTKNLIIDTAQSHSEQR